MAIIHSTHNLDALVQAAKSNHATEEMVQRVIDLGLDYNGMFVGIAEAAYLWRKCFNIAA